MNTRNHLAAAQARCGDIDTGRCAGAASAARRRALHLCGHALALLLLVLCPWRVAGAFAPEVDMAVQGIAVQPDGRFLVRGAFSSIDGVPRNGFARLSPDGMVETGYHQIPGNSTAAIALQADGKALVAGADRMTRINVDGTLDASFSFTPPPGGSTTIFALVPLPDGDVLVGGGFYDATSGDGGEFLPYIVRLDPDGTPDPAFDAGTLAAAHPGYVQALGVLPGGGIAAGVTTPTGGLLAWLQPQGGLDSARPVQALAAGAITAMTAHPDGGLLLASNNAAIQFADGIDRGSLVRLAADGSLDATFMVTVDYGIESAQIQPDGKILLAGGFSLVNGHGSLFVARLQPDSSVDTGFVPDELDGPLYSAVSQPDGRILVGGWFNSIGGQARHYLARLHRNGSLDDAEPTFAITPAIAGTGTLAPSTPQAALAGETVTFTVQASPGHVLDTVTGCGGTLSGSTYTTAAATTDCTVTASFTQLPGIGFAPDADGPVYDVAAFADGGLLVAGAFTHIGGVPRSDYARVLADGSLDTAFHASTVAAGVAAIAIQPDGKALIGGKGVWGNGGLLRINADGTPDATFVDAFTGGQVRIEAITLQADGKILIGGWFSEVSGQPRRSLARLNADGSLDTGFDAGTAWSWASIVTAIAVQDDGRIVAGGSGGLATDAALLRFLPNGARDTANPLPLLAAGANVTALQVQPDGKLLVGGAYGITLADGVDRGALLRFNANGTLDASLAPLDHGSVETILLDDANRIVLGGVLNAVDGQRRLVRLGPDGVLDAGFGPHVLDGGSAIYAAAAQDDGKLVIAGTFLEVNGIARHRIARLHDDGRVDNGASGPLTVTPQASANGSITPAAPQQVAEGARTTFEIVPQPGYSLVSISGCGGLTQAGNQFTTAWIYASCTVRASFVAESEASFDARADGYVEDLHLQADGRVLVAGVFNRIGGLEKRKLARLNPADGSADAAFGGANDYQSGDVGYSVVQQPDGKVLFGGDLGLVRFNADGTPDATFAPPAFSSAVKTVVVQPDGKILTNTATGFVRLLPSGARDTGFTSPYSSVTSVVLEADGRMMAVGAMPQMGAGDVMARLRADGTLDPGFPPRVGTNGGGTNITFLHRLADGRYLASSNFGRIDLGDGSPVDSLLVRVLPNGVRDPTFANLEGFRGPEAIVEQPDGRLLVTRFNNAGGMNLFRLARLDANGNVDPTFDPLLEGGGVRDMTLLPDGRILIVGRFTHVAGLPRNGLARLDADGTVDTTSFVVTPQAGLDGTIAPNLPVTVGANGQPRFTILPDPGYVIGAVTGCGGTLDGLTYTTAPVLADCSVSASFLAETVTHTVTPLPGAHGGIVPSTPQSVLFAQTTSVQLVPDAGYYIAGASGCGGERNGDVYTTGHVLADCGIVAQFHQPAAIATVLGTPQATAVATGFAVPLSVRVTAADGAAVEGVEITFTAPASGASAVLSATTVTTDADGRAQITARASAVAGSYVVTATADGLQATFALENESTTQGGIELRVTIGTEPPPACGTQTELKVAPGQPLNYCFTVTNHSSVALNYHTLTMLTQDPFRFDFSGWDRLFNLRHEALLPGATTQYNHVIAAATQDQAPRFTWNATASLPSYEAGSDAGVGFTDIRTLGTSFTLGRHGVFTLRSLPFAIDFYGQHFAAGSDSAVCINNSGTLSLHTGDDPDVCPTGTFTQPPLVTDNVTVEDAAYTTFPFYSYNAVMPFWDLLGSNGSISHATLGSAPNRRFIVQWQDKDHANYPNAAAGVSFQVVFEEGSNRIHYVYDDLSFDVVAEPNPDLGGSATVGLLGYSNHPTPPWQQFSYNAPVLSDGQVITWTPTDVVRHASASVVVDAAAPNLTLAPASIAANAPVGSATNTTLVIGNDGDAALTWTLDQAPARAHFPAADLTRWLPALAAQSDAALPRTAHAARGPARGPRDEPLPFAVPAFANTGHWNPVNLGAVAFDASNPADVVLGTGIPLHGGDMHAAELAGNDLGHAYTIGDQGGGGDTDFAFSRVDTATFAITTLGNPLPQSAFTLPAHRWDSLAWDGTDDTLYAATATISDIYGSRCTSTIQVNDGMASDLYRIDPETAQPTRIGRIDAGTTTCLRALAVAPDGAMFGIDDWTNSLVAIDKDTGAAAIVGWLGFPVSGALSADFDDTTGVLYLAVGDAIYTVDTVTGLASLVSALPLFDDAPMPVRGLSIATVGGACTDPDSVPWLTLGTSAGSTPAAGSTPVTVGLDATGLAPGLHRAQLCLFSSDRSHALVRVPVDFTVGLPSDTVFADGFED